MESSDATAVRRVRCPRCHCVLEEPSAPVYQCGGCGASLRAKNRTVTGSGSGAGDAARASPSRTGLPAQQRQTRHLDASDVASTSRTSPPPPPHVGSGSTSSWHRGRAATDATTTTTSSSRHGSGDLAPVSARTRRGSGDVASTSSTPDATARSRRQGTDGGVVSAARGRRSGDVVASTSSTPDASADADTSSRRRQGADATGRGESGQGTESTDAARKKHSGEAAVPPLQYHHHDRRQELAPRSSSQPAAAQPAREHDKNEAAAAGQEAPSPSRHELQEEQHLGPLRKKILKTVDELKGNLSELFSKPPELNPPRAARPPRLPKQEGGVSRAASGFPARARYAAAGTDGHRGSAARAVKPRQAAAPPPRGLPSRRYRQCRAHPCCHGDVEPRRPCHHDHGGCCRRHHGKPECSSCRGYCCRPRAQEPSSAPAGKEPKRRLPPRNHCRPVLKGAPFIVCSSCFKLVQVPADISVSTRTVRKLRCGSCSTVLSYSYRDPARKKAYYQEDSVIGRRSSTDDGFELHGHGGSEGDEVPVPAPFAPFIDGFGLSSYSTEDEQRLPVSRNTSFDTLDGTKGVGRLHRLMGYGSASELLRVRHSPDLYESFSERTTPDDVRQYDRKGKGVCVDDDGGDYDVDDSDEEGVVGALRRSAG